MGRDMEYSYTDLKNMSLDELKTLRVEIDEQIKGFQDDCLKQSCNNIAKLGLTDDFSQSLVLIKLASMGKVIDVS